MNYLQFRNPACYCVNNITKIPIRNKDTVSHKQRSSTHYIVVIRENIVQLRQEFDKKNLVYHGWFINAYNIMREYQYS